MTALIIDMRENGGGDPKMVAYVSSYLFDQRTHLNDLYNRKEEWIVDGNIRSAVALGDAQVGHQKGDGLDFMTRPRLA